MLDVPIYERIATLELFRPHGEQQDCLFISIERYEFCVLQWDSETQELVTRFDSDTKLASLLFLIRTSLGLPTYAKCKLLSALQQAGHEDKQVAETKGLLSKLMLQRNSSHLKPKQRLSLDEIELLCILLKIVILHVERSSILENKSEDVAKPIYDVLCVVHGTSEDDAVIKPCISVLEIISLSLYSSQPAAVKIHEAIMHDESNEFEEGKVIEEFRRSFNLRDELLQPAMVKVSARPGPVKAVDVVLESSTKAGENDEDD